MDEKKTSLLIVEDEVVVAIRMRRNLELAGYHVYEPVITGEQALASVEAHPPDVIIMDIRLLGSMDGIQAAQAIRARHDIPVIFITGYSDAETESRARGVSSAAFLEKPVFTHQLKAAIQDAIGQDPGI